MKRLDYLMRLIIAVTLPYLFLILFELIIFKTFLIWQSFFYWDIMLLWFIIIHYNPSQKS